MRANLVVSLLTLGSLAISMGPSAQAAVIPAGSVIEGKSLAEWSAEWWQWALSYPKSNSPLLDTTGSSGALGDQGSVFFLSGPFGGGTISKSFAVPSGKYIFFPVLNGFISAEPPTADMRARLDAFVTNIQSLHASVNGTPIPESELFMHREISPEFDIDLPADNIFDNPPGTVPPGTYGPTVSDGYWIMLEPLAPGNHVINFGGVSGGVPTDPAFGAFTLDVTYAAAAIPEPSTSLLLLIPIAGLFIKTTIGKRRSR